MKIILLILIVSAAFLTAYLLLSGLIFDNSRDIIFANVGGSTIIPDYSPVSSPSVEPNTPAATKTAGVIKETFPTTVVANAGHESGEGQLVPH